MGKSQSISLLTQRFVLKANTENVAQLLTNFWYLISTEAPSAQTELQGRGRVLSAVSYKEMTLLFQPVGGWVSFLFYL